MTYTQPNRQICAVASTVLACFAVLAQAQAQTQTQAQLQQYPVVQVPTYPADSYQPGRYTGTPAVNTTATRAVETLQANPRAIINQDANIGSARNSGYWTREEVRVLPTPQAGRITDKAIHQDYLAYEAQQARINSSAIANNAYATAKAQCWLDVSFQEYTRNDRSSFVEEAFLESTKITDALRNGQGQPWTQTPLINKATNLPAPISALWQRISSLSTTQRSCRPVQSACAEVELVHAGNEWNQGGARHAQPYLLTAERYISQAEAGNCAPAYVAPPPAPYVAPPPAPVVYTPPPAPIPAPVVVAPKPVPVVIIPQRVHFTFDQDYIAPGTNQVLDRIATALKTNPGIKLQAVGHTDVRATDRYNLDLSMRRVSSVMNYLRAAGVMPGQVQLGGLSSQNTVPGAAGKTQLDKLGSIEQAHQYNRRVEFALVPGSAPATLQVQYDDLHPCGSVNNYWCDNPKRKPGQKASPDIQAKMKAEKAQIEALMRKLQSQK